MRTAAAGLCHSDLHFIEGAYPTPMPVVLGHESAGVVEAVGEDVTYVQPGDHVISCLSVFCGHCEFCLSGHLSICQTPEVKMPPGVAKRLTWQGKHLNQFLNLSSFAEQMVVHEHALVKVRRDMPLDLASLIGCSVVTGYGAVVHTARIEPGSTVAVFGAGGIGLATINAAQIAGAAPHRRHRQGSVQARPRAQLRRDRRRRCRRGRHRQARRRADRRRRALLVRVHRPQGDRRAELLRLRSGGTATLIGMIPVGTKIELHGVDFLRERRIQGCMMGSNRFRTDMPRLIEFYLQGRLHLAEMVSARIGLAQINEGFAALKAGGVARNVIVFDS